MSGRPPTKVWMGLKLLESMAELYAELEATDEQSRKDIREAIRTMQPYTHPKTKVNLMLRLYRPGDILALEPAVQEDRARVVGEPLIKRPETSSLGHREP